MGAEDSKCLSVHETVLYDEESFQLKCHSDIVRKHYTNLQDVFQSISLWPVPLAFPGMPSPVMLAFLLQQSFDPSGPPIYWHTAFFALFIIPLMPSLLCLPSLGTIVSLSFAHPLPTILIWQNSEPRWAFCLPWAGIWINVEHKTMLDCLTLSLCPQVSSGLSALSGHPTSFT